MNKFRTHSIATTLVVSLLLSLTGSITAFAATTPTLGASLPYAVLGSTYTNTTPGTTITGNVGYITGPAVIPTIVGTTFINSGTFSQAGTDQAAALVNLNNQACTFNFPPGAINLSTETTHGTVGIYTPGVYCSTGAMNVGGPLTLSGVGTYIFRPVGALTSTTGSVVTLTGASACDVFWTPTAATTLAANTTFKGTVIQPTSSAITVNSTVSWTGRALAFGGTVTTDADTITVPTCTDAPIGGTGGLSAPTTLHIIKNVVNAHGGNATAALFNLHLKLAGTDVSASPTTGIASPGTPYTLAPGTYTVSEDANPSYTTAFSGDCDVNGTVILTSGSDKTCTVTNTDVLTTPATLRIIKVVVNKNGGTATASNAIIHVKSSMGDVAGSPRAGTVFPGSSYSLNANTYTVSEDALVGYTAKFSGACDANGVVTLAVGADKTCTITNSDAASLVVPPIAAPVVVAAPVKTPKLPNTGIAPEENTTSRNIAFFVGFLALISTSVVVALKKNRI